MLIAEIMHRVKNTLATVQAIAMQTLRRAHADEREAFAARLQTLSKAHDLLTSDRWDRAPLRAVVDAALGPFGLERITVEGADTWLNASQSLQLTLAMHELATNAVKYGALSNATGKVHVGWEVSNGGHIKFHWKESGGPSVTEPTDKGFGSILVERTFDDVQFAYAPQGLGCTFAFSL
jgi:two-component sensor histidine kinase